MKYTTQFKQEVRDYWNKNGAAATYIKYPELYPDRIRTWCDNQYSINKRAHLSKKSRMKYAELTLEQKRAIGKKVTKHTLQHRPYIPLPKKREMYNDLQQYNIQYCINKYNMLEDDIMYCIRRYLKTTEYLKNVAAKIPRETKRARSAAWRAKPEVQKHLKVYDSKYRKVNKDKIRAKFRDRKKADPVFRLTEHMRATISNALKGGHKCTKTQELLGCTFEEYATYLEKQFLPGMTHENRGKDTWHIDHIIPIAAFDLTIVENQYKAFNYANTRPMRAKENQQKSSFHEGMRYTKHTIKLQ